MEVPKRNLQFPYSKEPAKNLQPTKKRLVKDDHFILLHVGSERICQELHLKNYRSVKIKDHPHPLHQFITTPCASLSAA